MATVANRSMNAAMSLREPASPSSWNLADVLAATGAAVAATETTGASFLSIGTDSRRVSKEMLFVALRGENHDGHDFVAAAIRAGASAALVDHAVAGVDPSKLIVVEDTLRALGDLAAWTRRRSDVKVVAVTGSNGKTTTKELIASICAAAEKAHLLGGCLKTEGNFNNLIGLPLTLLRLRDESVAVLEMGMNRPGEIARLTEIAAPNYAVVTNVAAAHLEGVGGTIEGVASAKAELLRGLPSDAAVAVNLEDEWVSRIAASFGGRKLTFGNGGEVQSRAVVDDGLEGLRFELVVDDRTAEVTLPLIGIHNVSNALAAAAVARLMGLPIAVIAEGLRNAPAPRQRMQVLHLRTGVTLIDDAYNANPSSVEAAFKALQRMPGRSVVVLGDMRELGNESRHAHHQVGERAVALGVDEIFLIGDEAETVAAGARSAGMSADSIHLCATLQDLANDVASRWRVGDCVLIKGSHGMHMEEVVHLLQERGDTT